MFNCFKHEEGDREPLLKIQTGFMKDNTQASYHTSVLTVAMFHSNCYVQVEPVHVQQTDAGRNYMEAVNSLKFRQN
jgi:hypothetical protein